MRPGRKICGARQALTPSDKGNVVNYEKTKKEEETMRLVVGLVLFLVGINVGFLTAGLMHAAKGEHEQTEDENKTC